MHNYRYMREPIDDQVKLEFIFEATHIWNYAPRPCVVLTMSSFFDQHVLETNRIFRSSGPTEKLDLTCKPEEALFQICLEPLTSITPAVIAIFLLFVRLLHSYTRHYPRWMRPFINEFNGKEHELQIEDKKRYANSTTALLIIIPIGLALHVTTLLYPAYDVRRVFPALAWVS